MAESCLVDIVSLLKQFAVMVSMLLHRSLYFCHRKLVIAFACRSSNERETEIRIIPNVECVYVIFYRQLFACGHRLISFLKIISSQTTRSKTKRFISAQQFKTSCEIPFRCTLFSVEVANSKREKKQIFYLFTSGDDGKLLHFRDLSEDDEFPIIICWIRNSHNPSQWQLICTFNLLNEYENEIVVLSLMVAGLDFSYD